jgi:cell division protein FtsZ
MIELSRSTKRPAPAVRVLGVGGAGCNVLDRLILDGLDTAPAIALNTDVQALNASVAPDKVHLGRDTTRGLGAGGDPEVGYTAAEEALEDIKAAVAGAELVFLCAGLGGGTGSGAAPLVAHLARRAGATVIAFVTMPFSFEGKRRRGQADHALAQLAEQTNLIVCFENDRMGEASAPTAGVQQAFVAADAMLSASIRSVASMVRGPGLIPLDQVDLAAALRQQNSRCLFGHGESDGANRAHEALERALKSPLMEKGRMLSDAHTVLVHVAGGPDLTLNEVTVLMDEFHRHISDDTRIHFGLTTDARLGRRLAVTVLSSTSARVEPVSARMERSAPPQPAPVAPQSPPKSAPVPAPAPARAPAPVPEVAAASSSVTETLFALDPDPVEEFDLEPEPAPAAKPAAKATPKPAAEPAAKKEQKAEQMPLEAPSRGRFDKGEPTIVDGQDLDVPTFMRRNVKLK